MVFSIAFRRIAKREFDDAISWYEDRREGLGQHSSVAVERLLEELRFRRTSSPVSEATCGEQYCSVFHTPYISLLKTIGF